MNVILMFAGILSGSIGAFLFSPTLVAVAVILITTPLVQTTTDDMLIEKWSRVIITFLLITAYISVSICALSLFLNAASFQDRLRPSIIIIGPGVIQLFWIFLLTIIPDSEGTP